MEERVHNVLVGNQSHIFRGTWEYIHIPNPNFVSSLDLSELALEAFLDSIEKSKSMKIEPRMFLPTLESDATKIAVWKSQIATVLNKYLALPKDPSTAISMTPPVVEQISAKKPNIRMLKLMVTSDNLAEGVGQVFQMILEQSGLSKEEFFGCLQPMDGDLGTVWKVRRALVDFLHFSAPQHVLLRFVVQGSLLDGLHPSPPPFPPSTSNSTLASYPTHKFPPASHAVLHCHSLALCSSPLQRLPVSVLLWPPLDRSPTAASASGLLQTPLLPLGAPAPL
ncbi:hypothetical protein PGT21_030806 [Puccinia graminis f. sp. tritici]|uniref:DUF6589 domain-containing protein n=1 Tax=Puccinia graminis f. sp. tritici TaxID=56615 RepID=A0A5B0PM03_PUCGR|nr:hypothetical protein PGT21_030806 [Puccinia graminis f. sp. tritici]